MIDGSFSTAKFFSATYRLFKLDTLETACEDYGQAVVYNGGIAGQEDAFTLDGHHYIERGKVFTGMGDYLLSPRFDKADGDARAVMGNKRRQLPFLDISTP